MNKEYTRQLFILQNKFNKDLALKSWLMNDAFNALPEKLRAHAEITNKDPIPDNQPFPLWSTPPIKGFNIREYVSDDRSNDQPLEGEE